MKKLFGILIILMTMYLGAQILIKYTSGGTEAEYTIIKNDEKFSIKEEYNLEINNSKYYIEITKGNIVFNIMVDDLYNKNSKIIEDIEFIEEDNIFCMVPIFKGNTIQSEVLCDVDGKITAYSVIENTNSVIDGFAKNFNVEVEDTFIKSGPYSVYEYIKHTDDYLLVWDKYGFYNISKEEIRFTTVRNDRLTDLNYIYGKYYIYPNYDAKTNTKAFTKLNIYNIETKHLKRIDVPNYLSIDSYYQGERNNKIYIIDKQNVRQWELDMESYEMRVVGNAAIGYRYFIKDDFEFGEFIEAINNKILITKELYPNIKYDDIKRINTGFRDIYYVFRYDGKTTNVYKIYSDNLEIETHIVSVDNVKEFNIGANAIYYVIGNKIFAFDSKYGRNILIENNDGKFLNWNSLDVYKK